VGTGITQEEVKAETIKHYKRMMVFVRKRWFFGQVNRSTMVNAIEEDWGGDHCVYCQKYSLKYSTELQGMSAYCDGCPLEYSLHCCNGLWHIMSLTEFWLTWYIYIYMPGE